MSSHIVKAVRFGHHPKLSHIFKELREGFVFADNNAKGGVVVGVDDVSGIIGHGHGVAGGIKVVVIAVIVGRNHCQQAIIVDKI